MSLGPLLRRMTAALLWAAVLPFGPALAGQPVVSLIIDDLGDLLGAGERAARLPAPVACSILPGTPHAAHLAQRCHSAGKEVLLHLPMESADGARLGPGALTLHMTEGEFLRTLRADLAAIPHLAGVNNHMGSLLTRHPGHMAWLMDGLHRHGGLFFVDSRTTAASVAEFMAVERGLPVARRDVFLDNDPTPAAVRRQLAELILRARLNGAAIGIGHPYAATLAVLEQALPAMQAAGIDVVPVARQVRVNNPGSTQLWHASLSPSPPVARNSKQ